MYRRWPMNTWRIGEMIKQMHREKPVSLYRLKFPHGMACDLNRYSPLKGWKITFSGMADLFRWSAVTTIRTTCSNSNKPYFAILSFYAFHTILRKSAYFSPSNMNRIFFIMNKKYVLCEGRNEASYIIQIYVNLQLRLLVVFWLYML
jgi:hypothetical protein